MRTRYAWVLAGLLACTKAGARQESVEPPPKEPTFAQPPEAKMPPQPPPAPAPAAAVTVAMTAATLADDCGGVAPRPAPRAKGAQRSEPDRADTSRSGARSRRACDQS